MAEIIPMFVEDEITGCMNPNRPAPEEFWVCADSKAWSTHPTRNAAIVALEKLNDETAHIIHIPKRKIYIPKKG